MTTVIVTTCMGRLRHLRRTLPTWVEHTPLSIGIVDFCCPDRTGDRVSEYVYRYDLGSRVHVLWFPPGLAERSRGRPVFSKPKALNYALGIARTRPDLLGHDHVDSVLLLDADTLLEDGFWKRWEPYSHGSGFGYVLPRLSSRCLTGVLLAPLEALIAAGGLDERMQGWGSEDLDLRLRLFLCQGLTAHALEPTELSAIEHDDWLRSRHYQEQNLQVSNDINRHRLLENLRECMGWSYEDALRELQRPEVTALLITS